MRLPTGSASTLVLAAAVLLRAQRGLAAAAATASASPGHGAGQGTHDAVDSPETCESRTINYITHTLPQQCLRTSWSSANSTAQQTEPAPPAETNLTTTAASVSGPAETAAQNGTPSDAPPAEHKASEGGRDAVAPPEAGDKKDGEGDDDDDGQDLATGSFMSFEEWKEMMLRKNGQDPADIKARKPNEGRGAGGEAYPAAANGNLDGLDDDGEIALDFEVLSGKISELSASAGPNPTGDPRGARKADGGGGGDEALLYEDGRALYPRPKDAGKTCKERFSFSSFDGGATVLKTSPGVKNPKAILIENKDSYMLFTCAQENKYVIVELSEDILVDTVVLANFEFFSSMIRRFRVSVSDRYPVKMDKWKELGTFEARNARDLQAFLVENPKIWAKYIRIEFLTHYGNEYYCPVSLLRVHGTRMLDTWKDAEGGRDDSDGEETVSAPEPEPEVEPDQGVLPEAPAPSEAMEKTSTPPQADETVHEVGLSPWYPTFYAEPALETCGLGTPTTTGTVEVSPAAQEPGVAPSASGEPAPSTGPSSSPSGPAAEHAQDAGASSTSQSDAAGPTPSSASAPPANASMLAHDGPVVAPNSSTTATSTSQPIPGPESSGPSSAAPSPPSSKASSSSSSSSLYPRSSVTKPSTIPHPSARNKTSASNPHPHPHPPSSPPPSSSSSSSSSSAAAPPPPAPTVQESFFKTVSKRLQLLESNTTLSLQYIEDQSRFLQEALRKMERRQVARVDAFLDSLNRTVLADLRSVRAQYDQIWQSTVIALESQREASQREAVALGSRLGVLADEVVFQRRVAILQSVLLLACLLLVIFSRGGGLAGATPADFALAHGLGSPLRSAGHWGGGGGGGGGGGPYYGADSPSPPRLGVRGGGGFRAAERAEPRPAPFSRGLSYADKTLPLTPTSDYGRGDTPPAIRVLQAGDSPDETPQSTPPKPKVEEDYQPEADGGTESPKAGVESPPPTGADDSGEEQASKPPLTRSALSELDNSRKPLPALPEDPS